MLRRVVTEPLEWGVTPVSDVLAAAGAEAVDVVIASDMAAPVKYVPAFIATLTELFSISTAHGRAVELWLSCQTHREFTGPLLAQCRDLFHVAEMPASDLSPHYISTTSRHVIVRVRPKLPSK